MNGLSDIPLPTSGESIASPFSWPGQLSAPSPCAQSTNEISYHTWPPAIAYSNCVCLPPCSWSVVLTLKETPQPSQGLRKGSEYFVREGTLMASELPCG